MAELFSSYNVTHTPRLFWERLVRLFAISSVTHVVLLLLVFYVPTVRGMFGVMSTFGGVELVSEDYTRGRIRERATMINFTGAPDKLYYPPGYFTGGVAGPEDAQLVQQYMPPPPPPVAPIRRRRPARTPVTEPSPTPEPSPAESPEVASAAATATPDPNASPTPEGESITEAEVEKLAAETKTKRPPKINDEPFKQLLIKGKQMKDAGKLDLSGTLQLTIEADLKPDGTLDNLDIKGESSADMLALAREFVQALSDSKALSFIQDANRLTMNLTLDQEKVAVEVVTEVPTPARAEELSRAFNVFLTFGQFSKKGKDEGEIWKKMKISSKGKQLTMTFDMKREDAGKMLSKEINKQAAST